MQIAEYLYLQNFIIIIKYKTNVSIIVNIEKVKANIVAMQ